MTTLAKTFVLAMAIVAIYSQPVTAGRNYYNCPNPNPCDIELVNKHVYIPSKFLAWTTYYYSFPKEGFNIHKISCIHVRNRMGNNGADVLLVSGGVDEYHVSFRFKSRMNHAVNLDVYIYGTRNKKDVIRCIGDKLSRK